MAVCTAVAWVWFKVRTILASTSKASSMGFAARSKRSTERQRYSLLVGASELQSSLSGSILAWKYSVLDPLGKVTVSLSAVTGVSSLGSTIPDISVFVRRSGFV